MRENVCAIRPRRRVGVGGVVVVVVVIVFVVVAVLCFGRFNEIDACLDVGSSWRDESCLDKYESAV
jgi:hypothetical protein